MTRYPLEIPLSILAAGCIICILAVLGGYSTVVDEAASGVMLAIGSSLVLAGAVISFIVVLIYRSKKNDSAGKV